MAHRNPDDDAPLDPAVERVQTRLRRLILISSLTLVIGVLAVFGAILYRIVNMGATVPAANASPEAVAATLSHADLGLPAGANLTASALDGNRLILTYVHSRGHTLIFVDAATLRVRGRLDLPLPETP
jgi:hypothetical protein